MPANALRDMGRRLVAVAASILISAFACAGETAETPLSVPDILPSDGQILTWLDQGLPGHPKWVALRARLRAAAKETEAVRGGFYDPVFRSSAGYSQTPLSAPHVGIASVVPANAFSAQAGVEAPVVKGVYAGAGASVRALSNDGDTDGDAETVAGGRIRIPLLRDRGFALNNCEVARAVAESEIVRAAVVSESKDMVLALLRGYAVWMHSIEDAREVGRAMERAEKLLSDASERARLQVVAEYQVYPARYEAAIRREELESSRQGIRVNGLVFGEALGLGDAPELPDGESAAFVRWAQKLAELDIAPLRDIDLSETVSAVVVARLRVISARADAEWLREQEKGSLDLSAGVYWDSEEDDDSGRGTGCEIALSYSRPIGKTAERSRIEAADALCEQRLAELRTAENEAQVRVAAAFAAFEGARSRLKLAQDAVQEARRVLESEDGRFALGEGSSRNVLDAQKDLTTATRRSLSVSASVVTAMIDLVDALGIADRLGPAMDWEMPP